MWWLGACRQLWSEENHCPCRRLSARFDHVSPAATGNAATAVPVLRVWASGARLLTRLVEAPTEAFFHPVAPRGGGLRGVFRGALRGPRTRLTKDKEADCADHRQEA